MLKGGFTQFIEGNRVDVEPVTADFYKGILDTDGTQMKNKLTLLGWDENKLIKYLRSHASFVKDFYELEKPPITVKDIASATVRGLDDLLEEVHSIDLLISAIQLEKNKKEPRDTAIDKMEKRKKKLLEK